MTLHPKEHDCESHSQGSEQESNDLSKAGTILESKGIHAIFQKKGKKEQKMFRKGTKRQNI